MQNDKSPGNDRFFFLKNDILECAYYFFCTNKFTLMP